MPTHLLYMLRRMMPSCVMPAMLVLGLVLGGCGATGSSTESVPPPAASADSSTLAVAYEQAIAHTQTLGPNAVVTTLTPVTPHNDTLHWQVNDDGTRWVQVTTWTDDAPLPGADSTHTPGDTLTLTGDVWTTLVPAVQQFCEALPPEQRDRRLEQRLGLPPHAGYTRFITLWVQTSELFRPCPDPEITDQQCELDVPEPRARIQVSPDHLEWLDAQYAYSHQPGGYPFTGLGYTYDWGLPNNPVGISEFVVPVGATVRIAETSPTEAYCTPGSQ